MTNTDTEDAAATAAQVRLLAEAGSELVHVTVNTREAAAAVPEMIARARDAGVAAPIVGDFHYNGHTLLTEHPVTLTNVPRIRDVETMVVLLADIGADVEWMGPNEVRVDAAGVSKTDLDATLAREIRASFLLAGPLLARFGSVTVPPPGGDVIGRRRLDTHMQALAALGSEIQAGSVYDLRADGLRGTRVYLDEASVMGTENAIMTAVEYCR